MKDKFKILFLVYLLFTNSLIGQVSIHKTISTSDGLVNGQVREILKDSNGYFWFATNGGVSKWDGINFENFTESNGLSSTYIFDITEGHDSTIYFANFGINGINSYKNGKIDTLFADGKNKLSFLTLIHYTKDSSLLLCAANGVYLYKNNTLVNLNNLYGIQSSSMLALDEDSKGNVFIATEDGILKVSGNKLEIIYGYDGTKNNYINCIGIGNNDETYFTNEREFLVKIDDKISVVNNNLNYLADEINDIQFSSDNTMYIASEVGLGIIEPDQSFTLLTKENGLSNNQLFKIFLTKSGTAYIASSISDVNIFEYRKLENFNSTHGLPNNNILNFYINSDGTKYFNTANGLLIDQANSKKTITESNRSGYNNFISFAETKDGTLFLGTISGIDKIEDGKISSVLEFNPIRHMKHDESNNVFSLSVINDFTLLAGTYRGVYKINENKITRIRKEDGLLSDYVSSLIVLQDYSIVYGYHGNGISIYRNNEFIHYTTENGLSHNSITALHERNDGALLVGTQQGGLNILMDEKIDTLTIEDGLTSNEIRAINEDELGNIYVSTPKGVNILIFSENHYTIRYLLKEDGLIGNDCSKNALFIDDQNQVWIGTSKGLSKYNPTRENVNSVSPPVYITGINIFNKPYNFDNFRLDPTLSHNQNYLDFQFIGLNIPQSHKTIYQYKLNGVDIDWVEGKETHVQYTSLDDGQYTFEVKAKNEWGNWSERASLSFVINPAWWETWWFYTLAFIVVGSLIAFISSYRYRHLLSVEKMRTKISADLHDSVGSGLSEISILSELLGAQVNEEKKDFKSGLNNISTISKSLIESMSDIVWLVNPKKDTLKDLFKRLQLSYHEVLKYSDIDLLVENLDELEHVRLPMNFRQHLYLIFKEAINNAIKYSGGDLLNLKIETAGNSLKVVFTDNGKGFELNGEKMGNGIINMKNRAKEIGGDINYFTEINKGTKVIFEGKFQKQKSSFI